MNETDELPMHCEIDKTDDQTMVVLENSFWEHQAQKFAYDSNEHYFFPVSVSLLVFLRREWILLFIFCLFGVACDRSHSHLDSPLSSDRGKDGRGETQMKRANNVQVLRLIWVNVQG